MRRQPIGILLLVATLWHGAAGTDAVPGDFQQAANAVGAFMLPHPESGLLAQGRKRLSEAQLARVRDEIGALVLTQEEPFRCRGLQVQPDRQGEYNLNPDGTPNLEFDPQRFQLKGVGGWKAGDERAVV